MRTEAKYAFKKALLEIHKKDLWDKNILPPEDAFVFTDLTVIQMPEDASPVIVTAARDLQAFLQTSMGVSVAVSEKEIAGTKCVKLSVNRNIEEASGNMGYRITVKTDAVTVEGYDPFGVMQGLYFMEDLMGIRRAPYLKTEVIKRKCVFKDRMSQSPLGMFAFTDECFAHLTHSGMNTIAVWLKDLNLDQRNGYIDLPLLCDRAEKYGIGVAVSVSAPHDKHPSEPDAEAYYDALYGKLLKACPKIKSVTLVGESTNFKSKDPKAGNAPRFANFVENIPTGRCTPGWWPCIDYPEWISLIKKCIHKYAPDCRIIFSTYNWGYAPEEDRVALLNRLPTDIIVQPTWDMFEQRRYKNSVQDGVDYTLAFPGPGKYFISEAEACSRRGIEVQANSQSSGRTWDFGVVPYEPMPYQWMKRYRGLVAAAERWGVRSLAENIHYAFQPSIISELEKFMFFTPYDGYTPEEFLVKLIERDYGVENARAVEEAMRCFSQAIEHYPPTNEDQYGAFRIGPAYPLWMTDPRVGLTPYPGEGKKPAQFNAMFGNGIYFPFYTPDVAGRNSLPGVRIFDEMECIDELKSLLEKGLDILEGCREENESLCKLKALARFMINTCVTANHVKRLYIVMQKLNVVGKKEEAAKLLDEVETILLEERENVEATIPAVRVDSRLGWEPSMEYMGDEDGLLWKLRQLDHELRFKLPQFRASNSL